MITRDLNRTTAILACSCLLPYTVPWQPGKTTFPCRERWLKWIDSLHSYFYFTFIHINKCSIRLLFSLCFILVNVFSVLYDLYCVGASWIPTNQILKTKMFNRYAFDLSFRLTITTIANCLHFVCFTISIYLVFNASTVFHRTESKAVKCKAYSNKWQNC